MVYKLIFFFDDQMKYDGHQGNISIIALCISRQNVRVEIL